MLGSDRGQDRFLAAVSRLQKDFKPVLDSVGPGVPVRLDLVEDMSGELGSTSLVMAGNKASHFLICLDLKTVAKSPDLAIMLLAHEWGHALAWGCNEELAHGDKWACLHAMVWRYLNNEEILTTKEKEEMDETERAKLAGVLRFPHHR